MSDDFFFDPGEQEGSGFELIPPGWYPAEIIEASIGQPRSGDGHMLKATWRITEGDYEGRQVWQTVCYQHSNPQTQDIARKMLKDVCVAFDITEQVTDPEIFKFKPAKIKVFIKTDPNGQYDDQNRIGRIRPLTEDDGEAAEAKSSPKPKPPTSAAATPKAATPKPSSAKPVPSKPTSNGPGAAPWKRPTA